MGLGAGYELNVLPLPLLCIISHLFRSLVTIIELLLRQREDLNSEQRPAKDRANAAFPHSHECQANEKESLHSCRINPTVIDTSECA